MGCRCTVSPKLYDGGGDDESVSHWFRTARAGRVACCMQELSSKTSRKQLSKAAKLILRVYNTILQNRSDQGTGKSRLHETADLHEGRTR